MKISPFNAISESFSRVFRGNHRTLWLALGGIGFVVLVLWVVMNIMSVQSSLEPGAMPEANPAILIPLVIIMVCAVVLTPFLYRASVDEYDRESTHKVPVFGSAKAYFLTLAGVIIPSIVMTVCVLPFVALTLTMADTAMLPMTFVTLAVVVAVPFFLTPLFQTMPLYAVDNDNPTFGGMIRFAFEFGKAHYGTLILLNFVMSVLSLVVVFTFGVGILVLLPAQYLALAYVYVEGTRG